jgi:hypothetical protein
MKMKKGGGVLRLVLLLFVACGLSPIVKADDLTGVTSYYVRADGSDSNVGTSEDKSFKTLDKAVQMALSTQVKKITVIGTLDGSTTIKGNKKPLLSAKRDFEVREIETDGKKIVVVDTTKPAYTQIEGSYDDHDPEEILITGKIGAKVREKARLINSNNADNILRIENATVRLENIEISEFVSTNSKSRCIRVWAGVLFLGQDVKITNNKVVGVHAIEGGVVIMRNNAEVSNNHNTLGNSGVYLESGSVMVMLDNAIIKDNKAIGKSSGGGVAITTGTLIMRGNSAIANNSSDNFGGGIIVYEGNGRVEMYDKAAITGNTAKSTGGGVALSGVLDMNDSSQITNNTATVAGGGVYGAGDEASLAIAKTAVLANNKAPKSPDTNFNLN